jgi:hypothetical protein
MAAVRDKQFPRARCREYLKLVRRSLTGSGHHDTDTGRQRLDSERDVRLSHPKRLQARHPTGFGQTREQGHVPTPEPTLRRSCSAQDSHYLQVVMAKKVIFFLGAFRAWSRDYHRDPLATHSFAPEGQSVHHSEPSVPRQVQVREPTELVRV